MQGRIKLHRKAQSNPISTNLELRGLFTYFLTKANHSEGSFFHGQQKIDLLPGQFIRSMQGIADHFSISKPKAYRLTELLEKSEIVIRKGYSKYTLFTIVNRGLYQSEGNAIVTRSETPPYTNNNDKNKENVRKRWDKKYTTVYDRIRSDTKNTDNDNDNVNDIIYNKEDIQFNEDEKEIIKTYELGFNKLEDAEYRHKLNLLIQLLTTSGQVSFTNGGLVSYENEEGQIMNKIEKVQVIDYKVAKIKAIEVVSAKERYKVKDFWATLNNRIKKDLSPKKFN